MNKVTAAVVTMEPKEAMRILEKQAAADLKNRFVSQNRVDTYAAQMKAVKWELNGEPIILDENEQLLDGQHRLWACVQSECSFQTLLVKGVDRKVFPTLDTGKARTGADVLSMAGHANVTNLSAALAWLFLYEQKKLLWQSGRAGFTHAVQFSMIARHPHIVDSVQFSCRARRNPVLRALSPGSISFLHYVFSRYNEAAAETFFKQVGDEVSDTADSATRTLRKFLTRCLRDKKLSTQEMLALCVKAWAAHVANRPCKVLTWRRFGPTREDFPIFPGDSESRGIATRTLTTLTLEDLIRYIKDRLASGPVLYKTVKSECKVKGLPFRLLDHSASLKKVVGVATKKIKGKFYLELREVPALVS